MTDPEILRYTRETGDFSRMLESIPYATFIGLACERFGDDLIFRLPSKETNLGNPILPAIHGGVIGGFMEMAANIYLMMSQDSLRMPRIVDFSLDYLRAGLNRETFAECRLTRQGNRVANVMVMAWQKSRQEPIAMARAHFLLED
ncbi:PaaI family thioesterase [Marinobacter lutaoensis]|mgnify:CR=1 FL=1|jgi:acyl-coenzyme A thioesterase PaaI-like protein|uniref:Thioesterase n=1 Tax=Marinobacter lutaoensis TaxID=135739 RepID=A0A1V2DTN3_9GAMM|nr:PaaI family thioesterase [Marinobacter lutaoensis]MBE03119.1 PaaI family thioesterase [Marinobacter sp.]MBI42077.1 PaaI family thioesterase [Oceanospirillales bacterium]NVD36173.1 PaaI family thioesterase [Marinobacter lutaoensis]ONF43947.1 thioesterase [Marinobacter lutaoensis]|tara:strand:+ start:2126 stop:2560 length:435 start_codon:yes stop_codon:yes gene_type:complete